jgi:hypothetical protein
MSLPGQPVFHRLSQLYSLKQANVGKPWWDPNWVCSLADSIVPLSVSWFCQMLPLEEIYMDPLYNFLLYNNFKVKKQTTGTEIRWMVVCSLWKRRGWIDYRDLFKTAKIFYTLIMTLFILLDVHQNSELYTWKGDFYFCPAIKASWTWWHMHMHIVPDWGRLTSKPSWGCIPRLSHTHSFL